MADTTEEERKKRPFEFKARTVTSGQTETLEVEVRNVGTAAWDGFLLVELKLPAELTAPAVKQAALDARTSVEPYNMATLAGVVNAAEGWSAWAINDPNDHVVVLRVFNGIDQLTAAPNETNTPLAAGAALTLRIPLKPEAAAAQFEMEYGYQGGTECEERVDGSLVLTPSRLAEWEPQVSLTCDQTSPTMIKPGSEVKISWKVVNGVAATLRGPLPGGNNELTLSREKSSSYRIDEGSLKVYAVGPLTYVLDAEVKGPDGQPNVQVVRTLTLDIYSADKYGSLSVSPDLALPNGHVKINWAVWGVEKASLAILNRKGLRLTLTEQNLSRTYQGAGTWHVHASAVKELENVSLAVTNDTERKASRDTTIKVVKWQTTAKPVFTGQPVALAVANGNMALLTRDGLYTTRVGIDDDDLQDPDFARSGAAGKGWHALAPFGSAFVILRQTDGGDFVVERYDGRGQRVKLPLTLPGDFQAIARRGDAAFDLVGLGERVYVVAEGSAGGGSSRVAYSVNPDKEEPARPEGLLASLAQYRLVTFDRALYAYHRGTGRMLRFGLKKEGGLDQPRRAAPAVNAGGESMIKTGLLVPVGSVLVALGPASFPLFDPLKTYAFLNVVRLTPTDTAPSRKPSEIPQDIVYNPQHDRWEACGHGLDIKAGAVAAFRGGVSERLWVLLPDGELHTLMGAAEGLFAPDFMEKLHSLDLPPALDAKRQFKFANMCGLDLVPLDEACVAAGVGPFGADGPAELTPLPPDLANLQSTNFSVTYSSTHTNEVRLRFMAARPGTARYLLEVTLAGDGLGTVTTAFKRLAPDGRLEEVPGTSRAYPAGESNVVVTPATPLHARTRLILLNATPGELSLTPAVAGQTVGESAGVEVSYSTPDFKISLPNSENLGHLRVTFDYTRPLGVELSPREQAQQRLIRVVTNDANMLDPSADQLGAIPSLVFTFEKYDGSRSGRMPQPHDVYWLRIGVKKKLELDGVRLGDGALSPDRKAVFLALANPQNVSQVRVVRYDVGTLAKSEKSYETKGNVFSVPNAITVSEMYYDVMFAEPTRYTATHNFGTPWPQPFDGYVEVVALASSKARNVFNVGKRLVNVGYERMSKYFLSVAYLGNNREETPLDNIAFPVGAAPLAVSPDGSTAAIADQGGLLLVNMRAPASERKSHSVRIPNTREPAHVVFSNDGARVYCAHVTRAMSGGPRRTVAGRDITVSRVSIANQNEMKTLALPNVEGNFGLTGNTKQSFGVNVTSKEQVALSLAVSPDDRWLFVSAGTSILRINLDNFTLDPWNAKVELPCRLIGVAESGGGAWTVYALGSYYVGDGTKVDEYKTHLYIIPPPGDAPGLRT